MPKLSRTFTALEITLAIYLILVFAESLGGSLFGQYVFTPTGFLGVFLLAWIQVEFVKFE